MSGRGSTPRIRRTGCSDQGAWVRLRRHGRVSWRYCLGAMLANAGRSDVRLLAVHEPLASARVPVTRGVQLVSVNDVLRRDLGRKLAHTERELRERGIDVVGGLLEGDAAQVLERESRDLDLLVTGSRGYGPKRAALLGSVSSALLRTAECPIVVVPRGN
jgi:nucleotide-binding universal stress UspA family protein